ncbi:MAG TPA: hypothetical protein VGC79_10225 [Polyangiaceae bacterium]
MNKTFADSLRETRRLTILRLLSEQNAYMANSSVLQAGLHHLGVSSGRDDVLTDLAWLKDQGLVDLREAVEGVQIATLRSRGQEVANGHVAVPGVTRPHAR